MPTYNERSQLIKALSEQQYFDALKAKEQSQDVRIGDRIGNTGRYQVLSADGGVTSNGVKTFNASLPSDGFVRGTKGGNAIALDHRNVKRAEPKRRVQEDTKTQTNIIFLFKKDEQITVDNIKKIVTKLYVGGDRDEPKEVYQLEDGYRFWETPTINKTGAGIGDYIVNFVLEVDTFFDPPLSPILNPETFKFCSVVDGSLTEVSFLIPNKFDGYNVYHSHQHGYFNTVNVEKRLLAELAYVSMFIYSGNGQSGNPFSAFNLFVNRADAAITYYLRGTTGQEMGKSSEILPIETNAMQDSDNTVNVLSSVLVSNFSGNNNRFGVRITGSFTDHTGLTPPSKAYAFLEFKLDFITANFRKYLRGWDVAISTIEDEIARLDVGLEKKIVPLNPEEILYTGQERRQIYLTKAIIDTGLIAAIEAITVKLDTAPSGFVYAQEKANLLLILPQIVKDKLPVLPSVLPQILSSDEFFEMPSIIASLKNKLSEALALPLINTFPSDFATAIRAAFSIGKDATIYGDRTRALVKLNLASLGWEVFVVARVSLASGNLGYGISYRKVYSDFISSPFEIEASIAGVPFTTTFGIEIGRYISENPVKDHFFVTVNGAETNSLPFGNSEYIAEVKWRKRGNTEWFSV